MTNAHTYVHFAIQYYYAIFLLEDEQEVLLLAAAAAAIVFVHKQPHAQSQDQRRNCGHGKKRIYTNEGRKQKKMTQDIQQTQTSEQNNLYRNMMIHKRK